MADSPPQTPSRPRTATRHRYVVPPGLSVEQREGEKTIGRYEILEVLGKGAMGVVYKARDPMLDRIVAVKTIVSPRGGGKRVKRAYLERFEREAKAAAKMSHPAIVTIFDVGLADGAPFMVLEYLPGESLADRLDRVRIPLGKGIQIGLDLASALGFAHQERIVHRDVKPANVLHAGEQRWKLADFGIARMPDSDLTQVGIFMGTPGYAPPEAISQGRYTSQADVFAWGAVLYELLSGRIPYEGPDTRTTNSYVLKHAAKSPREWDPTIPEPLAEVVMRALHASTETRYRDGNEAEGALRAAWERCLNESLVSPAVLTGQEVRHEDAPKHFHGPRSAAPPREPAEAALELPVKSRTPVPSENDPTRVYAAGEAAAARDARPPTPEPTSEEQIVALAQATAARARAEGSDIEARARAAVGKPGSRRSSPGAGRFLLFVLVVVATLVAGAFGAYYLALM